MSKLVLSPKPILDNLITLCESTSEEKDIFLLIGTLYKEFRKLVIFDYTSLRDKISNFANCVQCFIKHLKTASTLTKDLKTIQHLKKWCSLISDLSNVSEIKTEYMLWVIVPLFNIFEESNLLPSWFIKEILRNCNIAIDGSEILLRNEAVKRKWKDIRQMVLQMLSCGDFQYQEIIMEIIFKMCSNDLIALMAPVFFKESELLREAFTKINKNNLKIDLRDFLTAVNLEYKSIISVRAHILQIENINITKKDEDRTVVWIDVNRQFKTISISCYKSFGSLSQCSQQSQQSTEMKQVVVNYSHIDSIIKHRYYGQNLSLIGNKYYISLNTPYSISVSWLNEEPVLSNLIQITILRSKELAVFENYLQKKFKIKEASPNEIAKSMSYNDQSEDLFNAAPSQSSNTASNVYSVPKFQSSPREKSSLDLDEINYWLDDECDVDTDVDVRDIAVQNLYIADQNFSHELMQSAYNDQESQAEQATYIVDQNFGHELTPFQEGSEPAFNDQVPHKLKEKYITERNLLHELTPSQEDSESSSNDKEPQELEEVYIADQNSLHELHFQEDSESASNDQEPQELNEMYIADQNRFHELTHSQEDSESASNDQEPQELEEVYIADQNLLHKLTPSQEDSESSSNDKEPQELKGMYIADRNRLHELTPFQEDSQSASNNKEPQELKGMYIADRNRLHELTPFQEDSQSASNNKEPQELKGMYIADRNRLHELTPFQEDSQSASNNKGPQELKGMYIADRNRLHELTPFQEDSQSASNNKEPQELKGMYIADRNRLHELTPFQEDSQSASNNKEPQELKGMYIADRNRLHELTPFQEDSQSASNNKEPQELKGMYIADRNRLHELTPFQEDSQSASNNKEPQELKGMYIADRNRLHELTPFQEDSQSASNNKEPQELKGMYIADRNRLHELTPFQEDSQSASNNKEPQELKGMYIADRNRLHELTPFQEDSQSASNNKEPQELKGMYIADRNRLHELTPFQEDSQSASNNKGPQELKGMYIADRNRLHELTPFQEDSQSASNNKEPQELKGMYIADRNRLHGLTPRQEDSESPSNNQKPHELKGMYIADRNLGCESKHSQEGHECASNDQDPQILKRTYIAKQNLARQSMSQEGDIYLDEKNAHASNLYVAEINASSEHLSPTFVDNDIKKDNVEVEEGDFVDDLDRFFLQLLENDEPSEKSEAVQGTDKIMQTKKTVRNKSVQVINCSMELIQTAVNNEYKIEKEDMKKTKNNPEQMISQSKIKKTKVQTKKKKKKVAKSTNRKKAASIKKSAKSFKDCKDILNISNISSPKTDVTDESEKFFNIKKIEKSKFENKNESEKLELEKNTLIPSRHTLKSCKNKENNYNLRNMISSEKNMNIEDTSLMVSKTNTKKNAKSIKNCKDILNIPNAVSPETNITDDSEKCFNLRKTISSEKNMNIEDTSLMVSNTSIKKNSKSIKTCKDILNIPNVLSPKTNITDESEKCFNLRKTISSEKNMNIGDTSFMVSNTSIKKNSKNIKTCKDILNIPNVLSPKTNITDESEKCFNLRKSISIEKNMNIEDTSLMVSNTSIKKNSKSIKTCKDILNIPNVLSPKTNITDENEKCFNIKKTEKCKSKNKNKSEKLELEKKKLIPSRKTLKSCKNKENKYNLRKRIKNISFKPSSEKNVNIEDTTSLMISKSPVVKRRFIDLPNFSQFLKTELHDPIRNSQEGSHEINTKLLNLSTSPLSTNEVFNDNSENIIPIGKKESLKSIKIELMIATQKFTSPRYPVNDDKTEFIAKNLNSSPEVSLKYSNDANKQMHDSNVSVTVFNSELQANSTKLQETDEVTKIINSQNCSNDDIEINSILPEDFDISIHKSDISTNLKFSKNASFGHSSEINKENNLETNNTTQFEEMLNFSKDKNVTNPIDDEVNSAPTVRTKARVISNYLIKPGKKNRLTNTTSSEKREQVDMMNKSYSNSDFEEFCQQSSLVVTQETCEGIKNATNNDLPIENDEKLLEIGYKLVTKVTNKDSADRLLSTYSDKQKYQENANNSLEEAMIAANAKKRNLVLTSSDNKRTSSSSINNTVVKKKKIVKRVKRLEKVNKVTKYKINTKKNNSEKRISEKIEQADTMNKSYSNSDFEEVCQQISLVVTKETCEGIKNGGNNDLPIENDVNALENMLTKSSTDRFYKNKNSIIEKGSVVSSIDNKSYAKEKNSSKELKKIKSNSSIQSLEEINTNNSIGITNDVSISKSVNLKKNKHSETSKINQTRKLYNINDVSHLEEDIVPSRKLESPSKIELEVAQKKLIIQDQINRNNEKESFSEAPSNTIKNPNINNNLSKELQEDTNDFNVEGSLNSSLSTRRNKRKGDTQEKLLEVSCKLVAKVTNKDSADRLQSTYGDKQKYQGNANNSLEEAMIAASAKKRNLVLTSSDNERTSSSSTNNTVVKKKKMVKRVKRLEKVHKVLPNDSNKHSSNLLNDIEQLQNSRSLLQNKRKKSRASSIESSDSSTSMFHTDIKRKRGSTQSRKQESIIVENKPKRNTNDNNSEKPRQLVIESDSDHSLDQSVTSTNKKLSLHTEDNKKSQYALQLRSLQMIQEAYKEWGLLSICILRHNGKKKSTNNRYSMPTLMTSVENYLMEKEKDRLAVKAKRRRTSNTTSSKRRKTSKKFKTVNLIEATTSNEYISTKNTNNVQKLDVGDNQLKNAQRKNYVRKVHKKK